MRHELQLFRVIAPNDQHIVEPCPCGRLLGMQVVWVGKLGGEVTIRQPLAGQQDSQPSQIAGVLGRHGKIKERAKRPGETAVRLGAQWPGLFSNQAKASRHKGFAWRRK